MPESLSSDLLIYDAGQQRTLIERVIRRSGKNCAQLATVFGVSGRTVYDWRRERCKISLVFAKKLARFANIPLPRPLRTQSRYAHTSGAGRLGGQAIIAKYGVVGGDQAQRKAAWQRWWKEQGQYLPSKILHKRKTINHPRPSNKLAEFFGILMGDGGISARQVVVTLHSETDRAFAQYYRRLAYQLFGVRPQLVKLKHAKAVHLVISRTDLVEWLHERGLPIGHKIKHGLDVPTWIKNNPRYSRFCLRGLIDTDGSVFAHQYRSGGKRYSYKKLDFCSLSTPLLRSAYTIFQANGMKPCVSRGKKLRLESQADMARYFRVIGSSNPKHLKRYR
jgi:DNA-binding XRE family transcriptional regulator